MNIIFKILTINIIILFSSFTVCAQDTDNDGMSDDWELQFGLDPTDPKDAFYDLDDDKVINLFEFQMASLPDDPASPNIVLWDGVEKLDDVVNNAANTSVIRIREGDYLLDTLNNLFLSGTGNGVRKMIQGGWDYNFVNYNPQVFKTNINVPGQGFTVQFFNTFICDGLIFNDTNASYSYPLYIFNGTLVNQIANITFSNCQFLNNQTTRAISLGGVDLNVTLINTLVAKNNEGLNISFEGQVISKLALINSTISYNLSKGISLSVKDSTNAEVTFTNTILQNNVSNYIKGKTAGSGDNSISTDVIYSDVDTTGMSTVSINLPTINYTQDANTINEDPVFFSPSACYFCFNDQSPCWETGIDIGFPFLGSAPNMGTSFCSPIDLFNTISGKAFKDLNLTCEYETSDIGLNDYIVTAFDGTDYYFGKTDSLGNYSISVDTGAYEMSINIPDFYWEICQDNMPAQIIFDSLYESFVFDFPAELKVECPLLKVNISSTYLRRCFESNYYVEYCNEGTIDAMDATIEVVLDTFLMFNSASILPDSIHGDTLFFGVGDVELGECGQFSINVLVDCDSSEIGQIHCTSAHIFPDSVCIPLDTTLWDQSNIRVEGKCEGDSVRFTIFNDGVGDMDQPLDYIIVIDEVIMFQEPFQLPSGEVLFVTVPAFLGQSHRMEAEQSVENPINDMPSATLIGCNGSGNWSLSNWFPYNDDYHFIDIDCQRNVSSFDPNDKQAFPRGVGDQHIIEPETEIEYLIRFQNTGTDTAFTVKVLDTLSEHLEINSLQMDVASHDYEWDISGQGILEVTFNNIMLPDSNINEPASHGFFKYSIRPKSDLPLSTIIENRAGIYFDFNEVVLTNTVFHTVDTFSFITDLWVSTITLEETSPIKVYPNPFSATTTFDFGKENWGNYTLHVFDVMGRKVKQTQATGNSLIFDAQELSAGIYFFQVFDKKQIIGNGKLVLTR